MGRGSRGMAWTLALAVYPAAVYWLFYVPVLLPRLPEWTSIPVLLKAAVVVPYVVLIAMTAAGSTWRQAMLRSAVATLGAFLFQWHGAAVGAPSLHHPDLDEAGIWALRAGIWWASLSVAMLLVGIMTGAREREAPGS